MLSEVCRTLHPEMKALLCICIATLKIFFSETEVEKQGTEKLGDRQRERCGGERPILAERSS